MSEYFLLIDFGATNTKAALFNVAQEHLTQIRAYPSLQNISTEPLGVELSADELHQQFIKIVRDYHQDNVHLSGILLCSQMHGFILLNEQNIPLTHYISWQDERASLPLNGTSSFEMLRDTFQDSFQNITGMKPRLGLPIMNVFHLARQKNFNHSKIKLISLPEWLALIHHDAYPVVHATMLAGSGFFDLNQSSISTELLDYIKDQTSCSILFNQVTKENSIAGYFHLNHQKIPIFLGIGDHQCALLGAGMDEHLISINIGTGSQVSILGTKKPNILMERRPYFGNDFLFTQTHIPAGRALNEYISFVSSIIQEVTDLSTSPWPYLEKLTIDDIVQSSLQIDFALYQNAFNYNGGGKIQGIVVKNLNFKNYLGSLLKNMVLQYVSIINNIGVEKDMHCLLSGGIPRKLPNIIETLALLSARKIKSAATTDETLLGLGLQALMIAHNIEDYQKAKQYLLTIKS